MKLKLKFTLLLILIFFCKSYGQEICYLPGTGTVVKTLDFESANLLTQKFAYGTGWAGTGFGLTGTQRGAPESISVIANPQAVTNSGNQVLAFRSFTRDAAWFAANPSTAGTIYYSGADSGDSSDPNGIQDDFFMTGAGWTPSETPSVMMHVYIPTYTNANSVVTSCRMTVQFTSGGNTVDSWPGIWFHGSYFNLRGPGRNDIRMNTNAPNAGKDTWWTFGLSITPSGDIQYYATPSYVTEFTVDHLLGANSVLSANAGLAYYPVNRQADAIIMNSNINMTELPTLIDDMKYTKGTATQVLSVSKNEVVSTTIYPNPTTDYLFVNGIKNRTHYTISDNLGRVIKSGDATTASNKIDVGFLPKGIYFLSLKGFKTNKFVKE